MIQVLGKATIFAVKRHSKQLYGQKPYHVHLLDVVNVLIRFVEWNNLTQELIDAAWLHDVVEDTDTTLDEVERKFGSCVAEFVDAVTNGPGATRKIRASSTYPKIRLTNNAVLLKLADRIANIEHCISHDRVGTLPGKIFNMYLSEWDTFKCELRGRCTCDNVVSTIMWNHLDSLFEEGKQKEWKANGQESCAKP